MLQQKYGRGQNLTWNGLKITWLQFNRKLTSPSTRFSSSSFCLAWSSAMRCSMALSDSRVNGRNRFFSSLENEEPVSAMDMVEYTSYTLVGLPPPDCWRGLKHGNPLKQSELSDD